jgi:hypothetical protein
MTDTYGDSGASAFFAIFIGIYFTVIGLTLLWALVVYVLDGFAFMKLYRKVGIEPWAAWVPYFTYWRQLELGGQAGWIALLALVPGASIVTAIFLIIAHYHTGVAFRRSGGFVVLAVFFPFAWAWILAADTEPYEPGRLPAAGFGPPLIGHGSVAGPRA